MYEKCLECKKLGNPCDGPNIIAMNRDDLISWCNARRKQVPGLTYDRIAELTGLSKGTVSGFFGGLHADYRIDTIRPIVKLLVGGKWDDIPCIDLTVSEKAAYEDKIRQLEESIAWRDDKIQHLTQQVESMTTLITNTNKRNKEQTDFLQHAIGNKNRTILTLAILLALCLGVIIAALIVDRLNGDVGFFWLDGLLHPHGINEIIQQWRT